MAGVVRARGSGPLLGLNGQNSSSRSRARARHSLQATVRRASAIVGREHVFVVTRSERHAAIAAEQLPALAPEQLLLEHRSGAPPRASPGVRARRRRRVIAALPADAHVGDEALFSAAARGRSARRRRHHHARSSRRGPRAGRAERARQSPAVHRVRAFVEKPTRERAEGFVAAGNFLWNSGMFFFRTETRGSAVGAARPLLDGALPRRQTRRGRDRQPQGAVRSPRRDGEGARHPGRARALRLRHRCSSRGVDARGARRMANALPTCSRSGRPAGCDLIRQ